MKKETALIYATAVTNYLAMHNKCGYVTLDISQDEIRVHYFDLSKNDLDTIQIGEKATLYLESDCHLEIVDNEKLHHKSFNIIWPIDSIE